MTHDEHRALQSALASLAAEGAALKVPEELEMRLLVELGRTGHWPVRASRPRSGVPPGPAARWALAPAACISAALLLLPAPPRAPEKPFLAIPYAAPLAPYERATVLRMDVPLAALAAAGFDVHLADTGAAVPADVLVGQDGRPLAIRFISISTPNSDRRLNR